MFSSSQVNGLEISGRKLHIVIAGAGSVGTVVGMLLSNEGHEVTLLRKRGDFGLITIQMYGELNLTQTINVINTQLGPNDINKIAPHIIFVACQRQQLQSQLNDLTKVIDFERNPIIVPLQNGLGTSELVCRWLLNMKLELPIIQGIVWWSATIQNSHQVLYHSKAVTVIGIPKTIQCHYASQNDLEVIFNLLKPVLEVKIKDIDQEPYIKLILNVVSPVLALVKKPYPTGINDLKVRKIIRLLFDEALTIAKTEGWYTYDERIEGFHNILSSETSLEHYSIHTSLPVHKVSSQISAEKYGGRGSNVHELLDYFVSRGAKYCSLIYNLFMELKPEYEAISSLELISLFGLETKGEKTRDTNF